MDLNSCFSRRFCGFFLLAFFTACSSSSSLRNPTTNATLWMQHAAEYKALTTSVYQMASYQLEDALHDSTWTAYPPQEKTTFQDKPPAIILDVDETVLGNAPFQARLIKQHVSYTSKKWNHWVMEAKADAIPGALALTKKAALKGIAVYYITNRNAVVESGTRRNLKRLGFPLPKKGDHILSDKERLNWTSAKTKRRAYVANHHRILMLVGDNLNDFVSANDRSQQKRDELVKKYHQKWGRQWFMLPNPVYGSWESALYHGHDNLSASQKETIKRSMLDTKE